MSAQMLAAASKDVEVSGESLDEMKLLEEQARKIAEEAKKDQPQKKSMAFVRWVGVVQVCVEFTQMLSLVTVYYRQFTNQCHH